jgi:hypothetical protein
MEQYLPAAILNIHERPLAARHSDTMTGEPST